MWLAFRVRVLHHPLLDVARLESGYTGTAQNSRADVTRLPHPKRHHKSKMQIERDR